MPFTRYPTQRELSQLAGYIQLVNKATDTYEALSDQWLLLYRSAIAVFELGTMGNGGKQCFMSVQWAGKSRFCQFFMWNNHGELEYIAQDELPLL